ncbi:hypothetical protein M2271_001915 [Streptomyces sp. LBL]|uniref:CU044_2847 family protein n=1 Tax=Streptomyces sp. LBL TaxID=2940562 RepID=UPI00247505E8|nr:CU044_2847 family protein [Streptomyces sp. LBL]MDH6624118.1 hypothetical protein [Streptomyces sp. LBL]
MASERLTLSDGSVVWVEAVSAVQEEEVAFRRRQTAFSEILPSVVTLCQDLGDALKTVAPHRTQVQFGVTFKAESTGLSALIAKAGVEANFLITLEWSRDRHTDAQDPEPTGAAEDEEEDENEEAPSSAPSPGTD